MVFIFHFSIPVAVSLRKSGGLTPLFRGPGVRKRTTPPRCGRTGAFGWEPADIILWGDSWRSRVKWVWAGFNIYIFILYIYLYIQIVFISTSIYILYKHVMYLYIIYCNNIYIYIYIHVINFCYWCLRSFQRSARMWWQHDSWRRLAFGVW